MQSLVMNLFSSIILWNAGLNLNLLASDITDSEENESPKRKAQKQHLRTLALGPQCLRFKTYDITDSDDNSSPKGQSPRTLALQKQSLTFQIQVEGLWEVLATMEQLTPRREKALLNYWEKEAFTLFETGYTNNNSKARKFPISNETLSVLDDIKELYQKSPVELVPNTLVNDVVTESDEMSSPKKGPSPRTLARVKAELYGFYQQVSNLKDILAMHSKLSPAIRREMLNNKKNDALRTIITAQGYVNKGYTISPRTLKALDEIGQAFEETPITPEEEIRESPQKKTTQKLPKKNSTPKIPRKLSSLLGFFK